MIRKTREEKAITLIALIITIVVLLILAVVAINAVTGDGIIQHATNAKTEYKKAQNKEENILEHYTAALATGEELAGKYGFAYYTSLSKAITDANNNTIKNKDADEESGVAGLYTDENGGKVVVLLKDTTENTRITITRDMTINLNGNSFTMTGDEIAIDGNTEKPSNVTIDARLEGSSIINENTSDKAIVFQPGYSNFTINGGTYIAHSVENNAICISGNKGNLILNNCIINSSTDSNGTRARGVNNSTGGTLTAINCDIKVTSAVNVVSDYNGIGIYNAGTLNATDCSVNTYNNFNYDTDYSYGIYSLTGSFTTLSNCEIYGTKAGVCTYGAIEVNDGEYSGFNFRRFFVCRN